jgi:hypothetical protein
MSATAAGAHSSGPPVKTSLPTVVGKATDGSKIHAGTGKWTGAMPIAHAYVWERCNSSGAECAPIEGATASHYLLTHADVGHKLLVAETASNGEGSDTERSAPSAAIAALAPKHRGKVTPTGEVVDGRVISVGTGTWKGTPPFEFTYQWYRCAHTCQKIEGAMSAGYRVQTADIGKHLRATITAKNAAGSATVRSTATAKAVPGSPLNLAPPKVSGTPLVGQTLTAENGTWVGTPPIEYAYQWYACTMSGCEKIAGQTEQTHAVGIGEIGDSFEVEVIATNAEGKAAAISEKTNLVGGNAPVNTEAPGITGTATAGQLLTASSGKWSGTEPIAYEYEWLRCNAAGAECAQAAAPSALPVYDVAGADVGHTLRVKVIATNLSGKGEAESAPTALVGGVGPSNLIAPTVLGLDITGQTLTASEGTWTGTEPISYSFQWQQCSKAGSECENLGGETKSTYVIQNADAGHTLRVVVTAKNVAGSVEKESSVTGEVVGVGPQNTEAPSVSGTATAGQLLTASSGKWSGTEPIAYEYAWLRCNTAGAECAQAQAPSLLPTYMVAGADVGHTLRVKVLAKNIAGSGSAESEKTATVGGVLPSNVIAPTVLGLDITGQTLTASEGTWTGTEPISYSFQWQQCSKAGTECKNIGGETKSTYVIENGDAAHTLRVLVTAKNVAGSVEKESSVTGEVVGVGPKNTEAPSVSGEAKEGQLLTASSGKWSGTEPITYEYEWLRCDTSGSSCTQAAAASLLPTYTATATDVGHTLRVKVLAKNIAGSGTAESERTAAVAGIKPSNVIAPTVLGLDITGQTLTASEGTWTGTEPISYSFQWQQCSKAGTECKNISGETKSTYVIENGDAAHTLRVLVTAKNVAGSVEKESSVTGEVVGVGPKNTEAPSVSGTATAGQLLSASSGKWSGTEPIAYEYEWLRCNTSGGECAQAAAPSLLPTYTVAAADVGHTLRVKVLAKNIAGSASAESERTATVAGVKPSNVIAPTVLGLDITGQTLTAGEGTWTGTEPISYSFQWQQCSKAGTECKNIGGETKSTYVIENGDAGHTLRVIVTAKNVAGSTEKESATTSEVTGVAPKNTEAPGITGEAKEGQLLTASSGKWSGTEPITYEYEWLRCTLEGKSCTQAQAASLLPTYTAVAADVGKFLRVKVVAKNIAGSASAEFEKTPAVKGVVPTNTILPVTLPTVTVTEGGSVEATTEGTWTGTQPITYEIQWKICTSATSCKVELEGPYATDKKFKVPSGTSGKKLKVNVIATNAAGKGEKEALELAILL